MICFETARRNAENMAVAEFAVKRRAKSLDTFITSTITSLSIKAGILISTPLTGSEAFVSEGCRLILKIIILAKKEKRKNLYLEVTNLRVQKSDQIRLST